MIVRGDLNQRAAGTKVLAVGDSFMPPSYFEAALRGLGDGIEVECFQIDAEGSFEPSTESELGLREYQGDPAELAARLAGVHVLAVHGAPVTAAVIEAGPDLELVCCARGGPVNIDVDALSARGLPLVNTPGKNADGVADLTLAFLIMLARNVPMGQRFVEEGNRLEDNFAGADFIGYDLHGHTLGLVGLGQVGTRVADRATAFGMRVLAHDPFVKDFAVAERVDSLEELLGASDFVSLHARASAETVGLIDASALALMPESSFLVNTARESLVDERALLAALESGRLRGAALDVFDDSEQGSPNPLLHHRNVVLTPHVGGATVETLARGAEMIAAAIADFLAGRPLRNIVNGAALAT